MGGGRVSSGLHHLEGVLEDESSSSSDSSSHHSELDFVNPTTPSSLLNSKDGQENGDRASRSHDDDHRVKEAASGSLKLIEEEISERRRCLTRLCVLQYYNEPSPRAAPEFLREAKNTIRRYKPGMWIEDGVGGIPLSSYVIPSTTTLLLVGPRGSGKSSLVNKISRIFEEGLFLPDRAQVSHNLSTTEGSCFLQEYMIPRDSTSFCFYDSRSLSGNASDNYKILKRWMTEGVKHGEMVLRDSDSSVVKKNMKVRARNASFYTSEKRTVNFVIFVVDGLSVLQSIDNEDKHYTEMLVETFNYPFMSLNDDKPVVVVTHGDVLSFNERAHVRMHLGELLGIPPMKQIFDIPEAKNAEPELAIVDMLRYSLEHADRNLPFKNSYKLEVQRMLQKMVSSFHIPENIKMPHRAISQVQGMLQKLMSSFHLPRNFEMRQRAISQVQRMLEKIPSDVEIPIPQPETWLLMVEFFLISICMTMVTFVWIERWTSF